MVLLLQPIEPSAGLLCSKGYMANDLPCIDKLKVLQYKNIDVIGGGKRKVFVVSWLLVLCC